jgi:lipopolysaccharide export LptBFGC system permease protein LptF
MIGGNYVATQFVTNSIFLAADELYNPDAKLRGSAPRELTVSQLRVATMRLSAAEALMEREGQTIRPVDSFDPAVQKHFTESAISSAQLAKKRRRLQVEIDQRYSMPFATAILTLLALPLGIHPPRAQRSWGVGLSVVVGIGVFVSYYGLLSLGLTLVESELVSSSVGVWIPNIVTALIALWLVHQVGSERVSSIADLPTIIKRQLRALRRRLKSLISHSHQAS